MPHDTAELTLHCPAKVNLALSVGPARADGLHPIASWMVALDFGDALTLRRRAEPPSAWHIAFADDAPAPQPIDWPLERDLAYRAHALLASHVGQPLPVAVELAKRVPAGAGLGGGSSDAAGVLVGLNRLFELGLSRERLIELATQLGSDVAFAVAALFGCPSAVVTGTGETLTPAPLAGPIHLALVLPPFRCPTGPVYAAFDEQHTEHAALRTADVQAIANRHPLTPEAPFNDLAEPAGRVQPPLADARSRLARTLGIPAHVTGSGAAIFLVAHSPTHAHQLAAAATEATGFPALAARTLRSTTRIV